MRKLVLQVGVALVACAGALAAHADVSVTAGTELTATSTAYASAAPAAHDVTIASSGDYTLTLRDLGFPQALASVGAILVQDTTTVATLAAPGSVTFTATGGHYRLQVLGDGTAAGSAAVEVVPQGGAPVASFVDALNAASTVTDVGSLDASFVIHAAGNYQLVATDLAFPAALVQLNVAVLAPDGSIAGMPLAGAGTIQFSATPGTYRVLVNAVVSGATHAGNYGIDVAPAGGGTSVYSTVQAISTSPPPANPSFLYAVDFPAAGDYLVDIADLKFPSSTVSLTYAAIQGVNTLGTATDTTPLAIHAAKGAGQLAVVATPSAVDGLFWVRVRPAAGGAVVFETTQGVGASVKSVPVDMPAEGPYQVRLTDFAFPANYSQLYMMVTQGNTPTPGLGEFIGGGLLDVPAKQGRYWLNFYAAPAIGSHYGLLGYAVGAPTPTVTLAADATNVGSGGSVKLTWSSTGAGSCKADGWTSSTAASGSADSGALSATRSFSLTCTGPGGSKTASVTVTVAAKSSGGGGIMGPLWLLLLAAAGGVPAWRRRAQSLHSI